MQKRYLETGQIVSTHGVRGEVRVQPWCDSVDFLKAFRTLYRDGEGGRPVRVLSCRAHGRVAIMKLEGVDTPEQAQTLRGQVLWCDRADAPPVDGWFIQDLLGCRVIDDADPQKVYGTLCDVFATGANDVWTVRSDGGREYMLPVIDDVVKSVDTSEGVIRITPLKGIFDA